MPRTLDWSSLTFDHHKRLIVRSAESAALFAPFGRGLAQA